MRDVLALTRLAESVALDRARQNHGRHALGQHGCPVRVVDLDRIVAADLQMLELVV